ncbi:unnamed protein product [Phytophthora lilii]|uniref:Unnamed protein product n=1 Tax=Phytophthora lilii TaxID=2077276 RepID=A0A9W6UFQ4_9STRA|nr:unnamed protein product [Phytophthora lilii]
MRGEIDCKAPSLTLLRQKALHRLRSWDRHDLLHVKRAWNAIADSLASAALQREYGVVIDTEEARDDLVTLNRLDEVLNPQTENDVAHVTAVATRSRSRNRSNPEVLNEEVVQSLRVN